MASVLLSRNFCNSEKDKRAAFDRPVRPRDSHKFACSNMRPYSHLITATGSALTAREGHQPGARRLKQPLNSKKKTPCQATRKICCM
jgi:hypothetical protein